MYNFTLMQYEVDEKMRSLRQPYSAAERYLADLREEASHRPSLRRRLAGAIVGFALKIDPEAVAVAPRQMVLEAANVRD
jgi:hypothetical protein